MAETRSLVDYWPLFGLRLRTPRLTLTPLAESDLPEALEIVLGGIHPEEQMPFMRPWTAVPRAELVGNTLRHWWTQRGSATPEDWSVPFAVRIDGVLAGLQDLVGRAFAVRRLVSTGSWLGQAHQGRGIGTEMRCAVLQFAFDSLGATRADSGAFLDNPASLRVSEKVGYQLDGTAVHERRPGERAVEQRLTLTPETFRRPSWTVGVDGFEPCRSFFGL
jgi:RimJ/RimL family protein N-acetyltransferase